MNNVDPDALIEFIYTYCAKTLGKDIRNRLTNDTPVTRMLTGSDLFHLILELEQKYAMRFTAEQLQNYGLITINKIADAALVTIKS